MTAPGVWQGPPAPPRKRRRRWVGTMVGAWIVVLALISWWSIRNDPPTVPEQRTIGQATPALRKAAGVLLAAAETAATQPPAATPGGPTPADATPTGATPSSGTPTSATWAVRLGAVKSESCALTPVRDGVEAHREVFLYVPQGQAETAMERVATALPRDYRAGVVALRVGTRLSFFADAGDFIAIDGEAKPDDQVLTLSASTGCRPGTTAGGTDPAARPVPATLGQTVVALGGRADAAVSTQVVACPEGGTAATYQATAGPSGDGPRGVPAGVTPAWTAAGGWAYGKDSEFVVVDDTGESLRVSVTTTCAQ